MNAPLAAHCVVCGQAVPGWLPHPHLEARSPFMKLMQAVGSDLQLYQCPACGCNDRDRHLWLYFQALDLPAQLAGWRVLHLAPERRLEPLIESCRPAQYVRGDLHPTRPDIRRVDAEAMPFADAAFDLLIANHLLEHVADPGRALAEFHRCLRPGGLLVAQTPYSPLLRSTFELKVPAGPEFAAMFYGQNDHVRLFAEDLVELVHAAGFEGELLPHEVLLPGVAAAAAGVNAREPLFMFTRR
ncbi:MAG: class I SAM-dependent methyltransferase [Rubrivivax sp.]|nr:class I SAM-dependent methyltransferase [Rubrivivax sp.]